MASAMMLSENLSNECVVSPSESDRTFQPISLLADRDAGGHLADHATHFDSRAVPGPCEGKRSGDQMRDGPVRDRRRGPGLHGPVEGSVSLRCAGASEHRRSSALHRLGSRRRARLRRTAPAAALLARPDSRPARLDLRQRSAPAELRLVGLHGPSRHHGRLELHVQRGRALWHRVEEPQDPQADQRLATLLLRIRYRRLDVPQWVDVGQHRSGRRSQSRQRIYDAH